MVEGEILNRDTRDIHTIDHRVLNWKWIYTPQYLWISDLRRPPIVLRFEHVEADWDSRVLKQHHLRTAPLTFHITQGRRHHVKSTKYLHLYSFSNVSCELLSHVYERDVQLVEALLHEKPSCRQN